MDGAEDQKFHAKTESNATKSDMQRMGIEC